MVRPRAGPKQLALIPWHAGGVPWVMPLRLVGSVDGEELRLHLGDGVHSLGSDSRCGFCVDHPTVSRHHADIEVEGRRITIRDMGSRNGTYVDGVRVSDAVLHPGAEVGLGKVRLLLEEISEGDISLGVELEQPPSSRVRQPTPQPTTVGFRSMDAVLMEVIPELLRRAETGQSELQIAQHAAASLFEHLPAVRVEVRPAGGGDGVHFEASREIEGAVEPSPLSAKGSTVELLITLPQPRLAELLRPVFSGFESLLRLAADRASGLATRREPSPAPPPQPEPHTVVPGVQRIYEQATRVATGEVGVLISGESGTGKEVLARYIHAASPRVSGPFVALNCAALPRDLLESELFGIERGVATGVDPRPGKFELGHGGTLFLDEVADMTLETQARLLRVLQEGVVYRLGGTEARPADCRIVAATNRDLTRLRATGGFREDLYYRIAVWSVELPPLRHRAADIPNLAGHFLDRAACRRGVRVRGITRSALEMLRAYRWPGNIRQLENEMARAALFLADGQALESSQLSPEIVAGGLPAAPTGPLEERLARYERAEILAALQRCDGVASAAAEELGIGRSTLYRRMRALGIDVSDWRGEGSRAPRVFHR